MKITDIKIFKITPKNGLVGFVSFVLDDCLYLGNIGIFTKLNKVDYRLIFPEKKVNDKTIKIFHPLTKDFYSELEEIVNTEIKKKP